MTFLAAFVVAGALAAPPSAPPSQAIEFEPKVGAIGASIRLKTPPPPGVEVRFAGRSLLASRDARGESIVIVPPGSTSAFLEYVRGGKVLARSAVPFVVSGTSLVGAPKLIGLKEAIDVFGYAEARPEGGEAPQNESRTVLSFDDDAILTLGEPAPLRFTTAVELGDAASAATRGMGSPGLLFTARPPKRKLPPPVATPAP